MYFYLPKITNSMYITKMRGMVPPPSQNMEGVCNQITLPSLVANKEYTAICWRFMVLKRQWRDNAEPASNVCTNSSYESSGRSVDGAANY